MRNPDFPRVSFLRNNQESRLPAGVFYEELRTESGPGNPAGEELRTESGPGTRARVINRRNRARVLARA